MATLLGTAESETEMNVVHQQQEFFELFGHPSSIIYDCYTTKESLLLKLKLIMPHMKEDQLNSLVNTLWNQKEFTGGKCLFMSPIFAILVSDHSPSLGSKTELEILSKRFTVHPVFRVQKCTSKMPGGSCSNCCALFVDESARVYDNWYRFKADNKYDDGLVVAPLNGIYNGGSDGKVALELFVRKSGITKSLDRGSTVVGLASAGVAVATFIPALAVAPVVAAGAAVAGVSCALYTGFRSLYDLYDRKNHKQTINFKDRDARSSWLNVAAGAFSASAVGATQLVASAAQNGNSMSNITRSTIHALNMGALGLNTTGCLDGIHTMIVKMKEGDHISLLEISQLSALLFLLTHSVKNFRTAESVLVLSRNCDITEFKRVLSESQKRAFDALVQETLLIQGVQHAAGQIVVRSLKNWIDPDPVLLELNDVEDHDEISSASNSTAEEAKDDEEQEKTDIKKAVARSEYSHLFDSRVGSIVTRLFAKFKCHGENVLKLLVINLMQELSVRAFDVFIDFVESIMEKYGADIEARSNNVLKFEHVAILILKQLKVISADSDVTSLKEYLISMSEEERKKVEDRIRVYFEHLKEEHVHECQQMLAAHADIADEAKLSIMIEEQVDNLADKFKSLGNVYTCDDLRETIKDVLLSLSLSASHVFFGIVKKFVQHNGANIQSRLGRFIPLDIFMADIYSNLRKLSANCGQELELYLLDYSEDIFDQIEKDITEFYDSQLITGNSNQCTHCDGLFYN